MKKPPLGNQQQQQQHGRNSTRTSRWLIAILSLGGVVLTVLCFTAERFITGHSNSTRITSTNTGTTTTAAAAFLLRRPTGLLQTRGEEVDDDDERENGVVSVDKTEASSSSLSLWNHRMLQNDLNASLSSSQCNKTCCAPFVEAAAAATACPEVPTAAAAESSPAASPFTNAPKWVQFALMAICLILSALFSGLTLGVMALDLSGLEIVMAGDDPKLAEQARLIYPIRKKGNLLLCTLLLGNVAVNALLSILTADYFGGTIGFLSSTFIIVIFGEIVPQALCQRYSLLVGSRSVPLMRLIILLMWPATFLLAWGLDKALGQELATTYSNAEMLKLLAIHVREEVMDPETAAVMGGALRYKSMLVREVMTTMDKTFMLSAEDKLNFETIARIFKAGYSRIPVYKVSKNNVIGLLFVKDLIFIDPEDNTRVEDFVNIFGRALHVVWPDDSLGDVLRELKKGKSHMALVRDVNNEDDQQDPYYEIKGIVTLEDIIEEILGEEIVDETDAFVDNTHAQSAPRPGMRPDGSIEETSFRWGALRLLDAKIVDETLSHDETKAVVAHLSKNYARALGQSVLLTENQLYKLVATTPVSLLPTAPQEIGQEIPASEDLLYEKGVPNDYCTIILSGKVTVLVGADNFRSDVSSWSVLAVDAMTGGHSGAYKPDFSAFVSAGPCRCLRISQAKFSEAVDSSAVERHESNHARKSNDGGGGGHVRKSSDGGGGHVRKSSDGGGGGGSSIGSVAKSNSKTIGTGTSTSGGTIVLGGNSTGGTSAEVTSTGTVTATGTSAAATATTTPDVTLAEMGSNKKQRFFAALKVAAGEVPPLAAAPPLSPTAPSRQAHPPIASTDTTNAAAPLDATTVSGGNKKNSDDK